MNGSVSFSTSLWWLNTWGWRGVMAGLICPFLRAGIGPQLAPHFQAPEPMLTAGIFWRVTGSHPQAAACFHCAGVATSIHSDSREAPACGPHLLPPERPRPGLGRSALQVPARLGSFLCMVTWLPSPAPRLHKKKMPFLIWLEIKPGQLMRGFSDFPHCPHYVLLYSVYV